MEPYGIVYIFTNPFNHKKYIGQTTQSIYDRAKPSNYNQEFAAALKELGGIEEFGYEQIECDSQLMLNFTESKLIMENKTYVPEFGYNQNRGMRPTVCQETLEVFPNVAATERAIKIPQGTLFNYLIHPLPEPRTGLHFNYASEEDIYHFLEHPELKDTSLQLARENAKIAKLSSLTSYIRQKLSILESKGNSDFDEQIDLINQQLRILDRKIANFLKGD